MFPFVFASQLSDSILRSSAYLQHWNFNCQPMYSLTFTWLLLVPRCHWHQLKYLVPLIGVQIQLDERDGRISSDCFVVQVCNRPLPLKILRSHLRSWDSIVLNGNHVSQTRLVFNIASLHLPLLSSIFLHWFFGWDYPHWSPAVQTTVQLVDAMASDVHIPIKLPTLLNTDICSLPLFPHRKFLIWQCRMFFYNKGKSFTYY